MSLFKTREWWSATGDGEELHTTGSLLVAALGDDRYGKCCCCKNNYFVFILLLCCINNLHNTDKIMVGSLSGLVRFYSPKPSPFSPDHLILEKQLSQPVIQLESGLLLPYVSCLYIVT